MPHPAIIPVERRIKTCHDYFEEARALQQYNKALPQEQAERSRVRRYGLASLMEMFDTVRIDERFKAGDLVGELTTLRHLSVQSQYNTIRAVLDWAATHDNPSVEKIGSSFYRMRPANE